MTVSFPAAGKVRFSYERRTGDTAPYSIALQSSAALAAWSAPAPTTTFPTDNAAIEIAHDFDLPPGEKFFARLRATAP